MPGAPPRIAITDTTLRDGQQCLWATRMTTAMMLPVAERLDHAGFDVIEVFGAVQFDASVRFLQENPWERLRLLRERITGTPLQALIRSSCVLGFEPQPEDLNRLWVERLVANGIRSFVAFDGLHDLDNLRVQIRHAKDLGVPTTGWLTFSDSPVHTDELYVAKAREFIEDCGCETVMIEDTSGILTPERVRTLVPAVRAAIGNRPLALHSHGLIGLPQRTYLAACAEGVDGVFTCIPPVADGNAPPSVVTTVANLCDAGFRADVDLDLLQEVAEHLDGCARRAGLPRGVPGDFSVANMNHQIPGGVLSNLVSQLRAVDLEHKLPAVLEECTRVRAELGWPIQVTPFAQLIGVQATLNVIGGGERYAQVPDEVKKYALGYYGKPLAPVEPDILDRIVENGSRYIRQDRPALEPVLPALRKQYPDADGDELLLRAGFKSEVVNGMFAATPDYGAHAHPETPLVRLVRHLTTLDGPVRVFVRKGSTEIRFATGDA